MFISQPIKGTAKRSDAEEDEKQKLNWHRIQERAENIMITDLVRNDLSPILLKRLH
jgi:para-aminobenzoate synthetase component 1